MTRNRYLKRMKQHEASFDKLWMKMVNDTNEYIESEKESKTSTADKLERFIDQLSLSGAWIQDRLNDKRRYDRGSLTKKIRRALGYTLP